MIMWGKGVSGRGGGTDNDKKNANAQLLSSFLIQDSPLPQWIYGSIHEETRRKELTCSLHQVNKTTKRIKANLVTRFSFFPEARANTSGEWSTKWVSTQAVSNLRIFRLK
jgi:hypothetical protein